MLVIIVVLDSKNWVGLNWIGWSLKREGQLWILMVLIRVAGLDKTLILTWIAAVH